MSIAAVRASILRDLDGVIAEVSAFEHEADIWALPPGVTNSAGTLALHLAGNLQHFVGAMIGGSGYARDRDAEFARRDVSRDELVGGLIDARNIVASTLDGLSGGQLAKPFPAMPVDVPLTVADFLVHLSGHLAYHLGQIDYHRRIVTGSADPVGVMSIGALASQIRR